MKDNTRNNNAALQAPLTGISEDDLATIKIVHRHPDLLTIEQPPSTEGGKWSRMATRVADLNISAPPSAPMVDTYFSMHGLRVGFRKGALVSYLNSVYADVDFHTDPDPVAKTEDEIGRFRSLAVRGAFPFPSIVVRSGRGAWFHFLVREDGSDRSVPNVFPALQLWQRLQRRFAYLLAENGFVSDPNARTNAAQLTRLPGSLNSGASGRVVRYDVTYENGGPIAYTMNDLARLMQLPNTAVTTVSRFTAAPVSTQQPSRPATTGVKVTNRRAGRDALIARHERQFWLVVGMHGGVVRDGSRGSFALCFNSLLYGDRDREEKVLKFCREVCRPAMTDGRITSLLNSNKGRPYILTDAEIWERLELTQAEKIRLDIDRARNPLTPRRNKGQAIARLRRRNEIVRAALACYMANGKSPAPAAQIVTKIRAAGLNYPRRTLLRDVTEMRQSGVLAL